jgi:hypothetical protein
MNKYILLILFACLATVSLQAQTLNYGRNSYRAGDIIIKQQVDFKDPGASGRDIQWDFSHVSTVNDKYQLVYYFPAANDTIHLVGYEHNTQYHYTIYSDTLWLVSYKNPTTEMHYDKPEALLRFPFCYGDTMRTPFSGKGMYCQRIGLLSEGYTKITVDATGKLITPDNDTLKVMRVYRQKEFTNIGSDSIRMRLESYQWFALGSRYPVFETVKSYTLRKDSVVKDFSTSFYFATINREQLPPDLANALSADAPNPDNLLISCSTYPNPVSTDLLVNYELSVDAHVSFLLCDMGGRPWATVSEKALSAGIQQQKIPMSGLPRGGYGLYIRVNGNVYRRTVIKI